MHFAFLKSGVLIALIAHGLIGISLIWDKVLLKQPETKNLVNYVFWLGAISIFGLVLILATAVEALAPFIYAIF